MPENNTVCKFAGSSNLLDCITPKKNLYSGKQHIKPFTTYSTENDKEHSNYCTWQGTRRLVPAIGHANGQAVEACRLCTQRTQRNGIYRGRRR